MRAFSMYVTCSTLLVLKTGTIMNKTRVFRTLYTIYLMFSARRFFLNSNFYFIPTYAYSLNSYSASTYSGLLNGYCLYNTYSWVQ